MIKILVVEDDIRMRSLIAELLRREGYSVSLAEDGTAAIIQLDEKSFDLVLTDLKFPQGDGMEVLIRSREVDPNVPVIIMTGYATVSSAVQAMKEGAYDYLQKPFEPDELLLVVKRAAEYRALIKENIRLSAELETCASDEFVGSSKSVIGIREMVQRVAPFDSTVLIVGETGTGKEMVASLIHKLSNRSAEKFLPVDCGALTESLLEAELFGYEKGAFTGAVEKKRGLFEAAGNGTLFLDEISNASPSVQMKLLRVLQDGKVMRVGGVEPFQVDVRVIVASNIDLKSEVEKGSFRSDLFYRLNVTQIDVPPLRDRPEDIPLLAYHFLNKYSVRFGKKVNGLHASTLKALVRYQWPGNVRELENAIEHAVIMAQEGKAITTDRLPETIRSSHRNAIPSRKSTLRLDELELSTIKSALQVYEGNRKRVAEALGISVPTLWRKLKKFQLL
jgi:DNA-binding NtrC family response regulator